MKLAALLLGTLAACAGPRPGRTLFTSRVDELRVTVNNGGPFRFGLDTGASGQLGVDPLLVARLNLPVVGHVAASDGANGSDINIVRIAELRLGELTWHDVDAPVVAHVQPADRSGEPILGSLGFGLFDAYLLMLLDGGRELRVLEGGLPPADGDAILDTTDDHGMPSVVLHLAGQDVPALLDSGAEWSVLLPAAWEQRFEFIEPPHAVGKAQTLFSEFEIREGRVKGELRLGGITLTDPVVRFADMFEAANVGRGLLEKAVVSFDQRNHRVRIVQRPGA
jgi:hypothetical protein